MIGLKDFLEVLKTLKEIEKEKKEEAKYRATLAQMPLCYDAINYMIQKADTTDVVIEIKDSDGRIMTFKKQKPEQFKSFKDKFYEQHKD